MARIKKGRKGKERKGKDTVKTHKSVIFHTSVGPIDAISAKFSTVVHPTYIMISANFGWNRLRVGTLRLYNINLSPMTSMFGLTTGKH